MKTRIRRNVESGLTLVELLVVIVLIAIVVTLVKPVGPNVQVRGAQTKALSNAKQIALALRLYASDHNGEYPSFTLKDGKPTKTPVSDSNTAFAQLFPTYVQEEAIFWQAKSAWCSVNPPNEQQDNPPLDTPVLTLAQGENEWAYVRELKDSSDPAEPLIADGFANPEIHIYSKDQTQKGGVWKGLKAIVVRADSSGVVMNVDQKTMTVTGTNGTGTTGDIFTTSHAANGWLAPENVVVNPK